VTTRPRAERPYGGLRLPTHTGALTPAITGRDPWETDMARTTLADIAGMLSGMAAQQTALAARLDALETRERTPAILPPEPPEVSVPKVAAAIAPTPAETAAKRLASLRARYSAIVAGTTESPKTSREKAARILVRMDAAERAFPGNPELQMDAWARPRDYSDILKAHTVTEATVARDEPAPVKAPRSKRSRVTPAPVKAPEITAEAIARLFPTWNPTMIDAVVKAATAAH